jgi:hypothetical protein
MKKTLLFAVPLILSLFLISPSFAQQGTINNNTGVGVAGGGQGQGQGQGQSINTEDNSVNNNNTPRNFPVPGGVGYGPVINYYGKPLPTAGFRPVETLLQYGNIFSEGALESILKGSDVIADLNVVREASVQPRAKYAKGETRWIYIVATTQVLPEHGLVGYITSEADNRKTDMLEVMAAAALKALREGADVLQIVAQGAARDTETSGWGVGFNTTQATMFHGSDQGAGTANVSSGGTGYSTAWAGMRDKPWIQCNALKSPTKIIGYEPKPEPKAEIPAAPKVSKSNTMKTETAAAPSPKEEPKVWGTINGKQVNKVN